MDTAEKLAQMALAVALFAGVVGLILLLAGRVRRGADLAQALAFVVPALALLAVGLIYPALRTGYQSFFDRTTENFVGLANYQALFERDDLLVVLRNTLIWVLVAPVVATVIGLVYAVLVDRSRFEAFAKSLIFMPLAISLVGASIIWRFVYEYRPDQQNIEQIGLLNQILVWLGMEPQQFLLNSPLNTLLLIVILIWVQAGFAMTVLSAAIKGIPQDIVEAGRLDGLYGVKMFRYVTVPSIRPALIVVLTTISIATLKVFDIVRTMTGGQFETSIVANEFYTQSLVRGNYGLGAALAMVLFVMVIPIVIYNVRQLRKADHR
ncbi:carbohydrate ABC transporter membrane protein 1 (CUT1 family) [Haloactinopolyspora alba]|uniref:Carbohydrate ABC transporter membrane protein 1 (CUT1 family) n=1 Tax=Haloactinopolyspora alba TaxID=648780 RepID=A0A2P8EFX0_9ACTN|nr:sugar ABC transporter permease [Haloactinopolyspora alba]PSL08350.1 carbohydrate ABC transporter membrane protein 1 (CUT1 family) [Haloactinopolyspora alba]